MTEIVKFVSNDLDELLEHINSRAAEHYEDIQQFVPIERATIYNEAVYTAVVVFKRRKVDHHQTKVCSIPRNGK